MNLTSELQRKMEQPPSDKVIRIVKDAMLKDAVSDSIRFGDACKDSEGDLKIKISVVKEELELKDSPLEKELKERLNTKKRIEPDQKTVTTINELIKLNHEIYTLKMHNDIKDIDIRKLKQERVGLEKEVKEWKHMYKKKVKEILINENKLEQTLIEKYDKDYKKEFERRNIDYRNSFNSSNEEYKESLAKQYEGKFKTYRRDCNNQYEAKKQKLIQKTKTVLARKMKELNYSVEDHKKAGEALRMYEALVPHYKREIKQLSIKLLEIHLKNKVK